MDAGTTTEGIGDHLLAAGRDEDLFLVEGPRRHSYADLRAAAARLVGELTAAGVAPGDRIAVLGPNSFFWAAGYLAALKLGVAVPLSDKEGPVELAAQADWAGCAAVLADRRTLRRLGDAFAGRPVLTEAVLAQPGPQAWPDRPVGPHEDAALVFTSGTTSRPKAVRVTHANLLANTSSIVEYLGLRRADRMLVILPFHYCFGASLLHTHLAVGGSLVLCNTFTFPQTAVDLIEAEECTGLAGVPSSFQLLLRASSYPSRPLPSLRSVQQAGGGLAAGQVKQLAAAQPGSRLFVMYGQTEATARLSYLPPELIATRAGSVGRGIPGVQLAVVDDLGRVVPPGVEGEIVASGDNISPGYYNDPEATAGKFRDGLLLTGDLGRTDTEGFLYLTGRRGDFIKSWGHRISPQQVEEAALAHGGLSAAAVVGLPDAEAGEVVGLVAVPLPGEVLDADGLLGFLRQRLPKHMVPARVKLLTELPMTASGKVARQQLRDLLEAAEAQVP